VTAASAVSDTATLRQIFLETTIGIGAEENLGDLT